MSCALTSISQINDVDRLQTLLKDPASDQQEIVDKGFNFFFFFFNDLNVFFEIIFTIEYNMLI